VTAEKDVQAMVGKGAWKKPAKKRDKKAA